ncbi:hypothetical protein [Phenylobacterium sp.]|uniref:hypothetical protein n=1 Tax=Phenylobacterium sp. TaxID=1871053 RepID=UPI0012086DD3|nr:hypothetical protein [Phenylobacterium sp.]THD57729.1 MAG: hypothetical protein E8A49_21205 [Phenylobacterium sp.]
MDGRQQRIYEEATALWREVFGEPPPVRAEGEDLLEIVTRCLPELPYERLRSPHLRPGTIAGPGQPGTETPAS